MCHPDLVPDPNLPTCLPPPQHSEASAAPSKTRLQGSSTRPNLYILGQPTISPLSIKKLPKGKPLLQRLYGLISQEPKAPRSKERYVQKDKCADSLVDEVVGVWRHHFGIRVIDGKEMKEQKIPAEEKIMIIQKHKINEKVLALEKKYIETESESKRLKRRKNFEELESNLLELLETPMNILKTGGWRTLEVKGEGKKRVWLSSGEEILARSGIIDAGEDIDHLKNQLSKEQPGCCDSLDQKQAKRDRRKLVEQMRANQKVDENDMRKRKPEKIIEDGIEESSESKDDKDYDGPKEVKRRKIDMMGPMSASADRANLSCRDMALMGASAAKALGLKVADTNCSVTTAHRQRT